MKNLLLTIVLVMTSFFLAKSVFATAIPWYSDNFEYGTSGVHLNTASNGMWNYYSSSYKDFYTTNSVTCYSGNCITNSTVGLSGANAYQDRHATSTYTQFPQYGSIRFYQQNITSNNSKLYFKFSNRDVSNVEQAIKTTVGLISTTTNQLYDSTNNYKIFDNISNATSTWHQLRWEYSYASDLIRYELDNSGWSSWINLNSTTNYPINRFDIITNETNANSVFLDEVYFGDNASVNSLAFNTIQIGTSTEQILNQSVLQDFQYWQLLWTASSSEIYNITVQYGDAPNTVLYIDSDNFVGLEGQNMEATLIKNHNLHDGDWYATANLWNANGDLVAQTSQISFLIDSQSTTTVNTNGLPNNSGAYTANLTSTSTDVLALALQTSINIFSNVFPFNLGTNIYTSWTNSQTATIPSELSFLTVTDGNGNISYSMGPITGGNASTSMTLFGPAIFNDNSNAQSFFGHTRTLSKYLMWAIFILGLGVRGKTYYNFLTNRNSNA